MTTLHPIEVIGVRVEMPSNQPIVLVRETDGVRYLPIWVGAVEATAIAFAQQGVKSPRPLTHDLIQEVIEAVALPLESIHLTEMKNGIFYAELHFSGGKIISARPSDALAIGLRMGTPMFATEDLFASAGIEIPDQSDDEVEKFKEFLDHINPEDFAG
jgi:uncharacterized protein